MESHEPEPTVPPPSHPPVGWLPPARSVSPAGSAAPGAGSEESVAAAPGAGPEESVAAETGAGSEESVAAETGAGPPVAQRLKVELAVMLFASAVPGLVLGLRGFTDPESVDTEIAVLDLVASIFAALGPAAIATYLLWRDGRLSAAGFDRRPLRWVAGYGSLGAVCAVLALWSVGIVLVVLTLVAGGDPPDEETTRISLTFGSVVAGIVIAIVAGVGEEIVYRAYAISRLEELGWVRAAVWGPWAVFTLQHLYQGPAAILFIGAVGGTFVWLYRWQRSVWPVIVAHVLYDLIVLLLLATLG